MPGRLHRPWSPAGIDTHRPTLALPRGIQSGAILHQAERQGFVSVVDVQLVCDPVLGTWRYQWEVGSAPARKSTGNPSLEVGRDETLEKGVGSPQALYHRVREVSLRVCKSGTHGNSANTRLNLAGYRTNPGFLCLDPSQSVGPRAHWVASVCPGSEVLAPRLLCLRTPGASLGTPGQNRTSFR